MHLVTDVRTEIDHERDVADFLAAVLAKDADRMRELTEQVGLRVGEKEAIGVQLDALYRVKAMDIWTPMEFEMFDACILLIEKLFAVIVE